LDARAGTETRGVMIENAGGSTRDISLIIAFFGCGREKALRSRFPIEETAFLERPKAEKPFSGGKKRKRAQFHSGFSPTLLTTHEAAHFFRTDVVSNQRDPTSVM